MENKRNIDVRRMVKQHITDSSYKKKREIEIGGGWGDRERVRETGVKTEDDIIKIHIKIKN